ncbi:hypothetical protein ACHHYP_20641 [Achlya hypogyna]|uniref:Uncharacterized protein n=1 Tax=Achlya hypogyna TaxID=1202772 RepID=A0A1V9ZGB2_ACHHY|nr:hypothetical protein ACHHYP_20641 [Achlya hypogyna]
MDLEALYVAEQLLHFSHPTLKSLDTFVPLESSHQDSRGQDESIVANWDVFDSVAPTVCMYVGERKELGTTFMTEKLKSSSLELPSMVTTKLHSDEVINSCLHLTPNELLRQHQKRFRRIRRRWHEWHLERLKRVSRFLPIQRRPRCLKTAPRSVPTINMP